MEGQDLLNLVKGRVFNAELRAELGKFGLRRIANNQWVSKTTADRYEFVLTEEGDERVVAGVDIVDKNRRVHVKAPKSPSAAVDTVNVPEVALHHKTLTAIRKQHEISAFIFEVMDRWNMEIDEGTPFGKELRALKSEGYITVEDFLVLPDPLAGGHYFFGLKRKGVAASIHSWLNLPDGDYIVPTNGMVDEIKDSLMEGMEFHKWESETFKTAAAAGQYAIRALNNSNTTYAQAIRQLLGKEESPISRNDFYRNYEGVMCRVEVHQTPNGIEVIDVPALPNIVDCIDSLLAPYIKANSIKESEQNQQNFGPQEEYQQDYYPENHEPHGWY